LVLSRGWIGGFHGEIGRRLTEALRGVGFALPREGIGGEDCLEKFLCFRKDIPVARAVLASDYEKIIVGVGVGFGLKIVHLSPIPIVLQPHETSSIHHSQV